MREKRKTLDEKSENLKFEKIAKKQKLQERGITLIALVVTIVILLILAGVTLNIALSDGGLFSKTKEAAKKYQTEADREALEMSIMSYKLGENTEEGSSKLGKELLDKSLDSTWNIIVSNDKTYGTGWYYIEKGKEIEGLGTAKNAFVINYETGEVVQLEDDNYILLSAGDMLAVKEDLIINVDSSIIDKGVENSEETLKGQLGKNVELVNFDYTTDSGLTNTSFNFDGINDYIKVQYDSQEQKDALAQNGFTFEFYGTWKNGQSWKNQEKRETEYGGLFCYWNGIEESQAMLRFGIESNNMKWNAGSGDGTSDYCEPNNPWNIWYPLSEELLSGEIYITVTLDTSNSYEVAGKEGRFYKQRVYVNGNKLHEGDYNEKNWIKFVEEDLNALKYFCIGRSSMGGDVWWHYSKINAYSLRLYSKALDEAEVNANYEKATKYHELLE